MDEPIDVLIEAPLPPRGKDRPRMSRNGHVYTPAATKNWESALAMMAQSKLPETIIEGPVRVDVLALMPRSQDMCKVYKRTGESKHSRDLIWHVKKPDGDNIRKAVLDALKAFWRNDSQVIAGDTVKSYTEIDGRPRVVVRIQTDLPEPRALAEQLGLI